MLTSLCVFVWLLVVGLAPFAWCRCGSRWLAGLLGGSVVGLLRWLVAGVIRLRFVWLKPRRLEVDELATSVVVFWWLLGWLGAGSAVLVCLGLAWLSFVWVVGLVVVVCVWLGCAGVGRLAGCRCVGAARWLSGWLR